jgi:hypothetical protein
MDLLPSSQFEIFLELLGALGFGLAALWLLSSYLAWKHRMLAFLGIFLVQGVSSMLAFVVLRQVWVDKDIGPETLQVGIFLPVSVLVISIAVSLAGLLCRRRYGWLRLVLWVIAALAVVWLLVIGPFFLAAVISSHGSVPVVAIFPVLGVAGGFTFGVLLPFLLLSFCNRFYRERLKALLHLGGAEPPPVIAPPMPVVAAAVGI